MGKDVCMEGACLLFVEERCLPWVARVYKHPMATVCGVSGESSPATHTRLTPPEIPVTVLPVTPSATCVSGAGGGWDCEPATSLARLDAQLRLPPQFDPRCFYAVFRPDGRGAPVGTPMPRVHRALQLGALPYWPRAEARERERLMIRVIQYLRCVPLPMSVRRHLAAGSAAVRSAAEAAESVGERLVTPVEQVVATVDMPPGMARRELQEMARRRMDCAGRPGGDADARPPFEAGGNAPEGKAAADESDSGWNDEASEGGDGGRRRGAQGAGPDRPPEAENALGGRGDGASECSGQGAARAQGRRDQS